MKIITYGVIGCGEHARHHIEHGASFGLKLMGVFDPKRENAKEAAGLLNSHVTVYGSEKSLLQNPDIQAVMIASPDRFHPENLVAAIKAGKHVFIEKPLAIDRVGMDIVKGALDEARKKKLVVTSCHPRRFDPAYIWIKKVLEEMSDEKSYGKVVSLTLDFSYHRPEDLWKQSRSLLLDHFPHEIDCLNFFFGHSPFTANRLIDGYASYSVAGVREDGITFFFRGTRALNSKVYPETIEIRFERASMHVNTKNGNYMVHNHETGEIGTGMALTTDYPRRLEGLNANFANSILGVEKNYLTHEDLITNTETAIDLAIDGVTRKSM